MIFKNYEVTLIDPFSGSILRVLSSQDLVEGKFSRLVNGVGVFALIIHGTDLVQELYNLVQEDTIVEFYRDNGWDEVSYEKEGTFFIRLIDRYIDDSGAEKLILGGMDLNDLLDRRIIDPDDDSVLPNGGYVTKAGAADDVIREYVREQAADLASSARSFPGLTVPVTAGTGTPIGRRLRYDNLLKAVQDMCASAEFIAGCTDFNIVRTTGLNFECLIEEQGSDRTYLNNASSGKFVVLNPLRGNLLSPRVKRDARKEKNFFYVKGSGQGANRFILKVPNFERIYTSPYNRIEGSLDVRDSRTGNATDMYTEARKAFQEKGAITEMTASLSANLGGTIYKRDWFLGDRITVAWDSFTDTVRIIEVVFTFNQSGESIEVSTKRMPY